MTNKKLGFFKPRENNNQMIQQFKRMMFILS